jgi:hypothetical protein
LCFRDCRQYYSASLRVKFVFKHFLGNLCCRLVRRSLTKQKTVSCFRIEKKNILGSYKRITVLIQKIKSGQQLINAKEKERKYFRYCICCLNKTQKKTRSLRSSLEKGSTGQTATFKIVYFIYYLLKNLFLVS